MFRVAPATATVQPSSPPTLFSEARADHADVVERVLAANPAAASVREASTGGTALHAAAAAGALGAVRALLAAPVPARLDAVDDAGDTPLHCAARNGRADVVAELLSTNVRGIGGTSSLVGSSSALARRKNSRGRTPLHLAAEACSHDAARVLLASGARRSALDADGMTAADLVPKDPRSTRAAVLYAMVLSSKSASVVAADERMRREERADDVLRPPMTLSVQPRRRVDSRPWVAAAASRIATKGGVAKQQQQSQQQQLRVVASSSSTECGAESPAASASARTDAATAAASSRDRGSASAASKLFATSSSSSSAFVRVAAAEKKVEEVVDVVSRLAAAVEGTRAAVEADREAARREVAALREEARARAAAADEALAAVDGKLSSLEETVAAATAAAARRAEAEAEASSSSSYSSDGGVSNSSFVTAATPAAAARAEAAAFGDVETPSLSAAAGQLSTQLAHDHVREHFSVPSFAHVPRDVDGLRGALAALERRVARGEEWDAAASGFARSVGVELEKLQVEVSEASTSRLAGEARLEAAERGVEMLHSYLKTAAAALGPDAVADASRRAAEVSRAVASLANEKRQRRAIEADLKRVKEACRELQARLDGVLARGEGEGGGGDGGGGLSEETSRRRSSSSFFRLFKSSSTKPGRAVSKLGKGERRRLSSSSATERGLALATVEAREEEETRVVVEEAE